MTSPSGTGGPRDRTTERRPIHVASVALVVGLFVLSVFSVSVAVANDRAAEKAQRSAEVARLSEVAFEAVLDEEDVADDVIVDDDAGARRAYADAHAGAARAIDALHQAAAADGTMDGAEDLRELHAAYGRAVTEMHTAFAGGTVGDADAFEEVSVDPFYDPLTDALNQERKDSEDAAQAALMSIGRTQQRLVIFTPVVAGATLALIMVFVVKLGRSRKETATQSEENSYQALHDSLTGLPNRALLRRGSAVAVAQAADTGTRAALMIIDLDRFKEINDTLGHHIGDLVLKVVAQRLRNAVRSMDTVARLGGDEFAILLPHVDGPAAAFQVASKVQLALVDSIEAGGVALDVEASIGIALSGEHGHDVATLLQHADIAMYRAKGHDLGICLYDRDHDNTSREQLGLLGDLRRAIDTGELVLHFQPKVALKDGEFCGAESLLRWAHPTRGTLLPGAFLPAAERTAMIGPITRWVIDASLAECRRWRNEGKDLRLAVNISARNLLDNSFPDHVGELLGKWGLPPTCLVFEVTETAIIIEPEKAEAMLIRFADQGIGVSIDDFGAGYTSLAHLRTLPVEELKIDGSLVAAMATSAKDALIVRAVIDLARSLGLRSVAEGVEDAATLDRLTVMDCDVAQGFHVARPMTGTQLSQWSHDREAVPPRS